MVSRLLMAIGLIIVTCYSIYGAAHAEPQHKEIIGYAVMFFLALWGWDQIGK